MSDEQESNIEETEGDVGAAEDLEATAEAIGDAAEALAGSEGDDSVDDAKSGECDSGDMATELEKARDQALRATAELENFRRRVQREAEATAKFFAIPLIRDLLPALDNLGRTIQAAEQTSNVDDLLQGLQMIVAQFDQVLGQHSAKPIAAMGETFDPNLHEALQQVPTDEHPPMTIIQEVERGYILHDRVVRPSKVIVAAALPTEVADETEASETTDSDE